MGMERQISVMLKNSPGQMATVGDALAETAAKLAAAGINIDDIYGSAAGASWYWWRGFPTSRRRRKRLAEGNL